MNDVLAAYGKVPTGTAHVGGHLGQEAESYRDSGIERVVWFEANPKLIEPLRKHVEPFGHRVVEACLDGTSGNEITFHIADSTDHSNQGQSSSVLELGTHTISHPEVTYVDEITVTTSTLDELLIGTDDGTWLTNGEKPQGLLLNIDAQGLEGRILKGAVNVLKACDVLYLEINIRPLYVGCTLFPELEEWLMGHGFQSEMVHLAGCQRVNCSDRGNRFVGWGDSGFLRSDNPTRYVDRHPECADWYQ